MSKYLHKQLLDFRHRIQKPLPFVRINQGCALGWHDIKQKYRRAVLGPFWITFSMAILIVTMGLVFNRIYGTKLDEFFPFLAISLILWNFCSSTVTEGCESYTASESLIKQLPLPMYLYLIRMLWRNVIILCHNIIIFPIVFILLNIELNKNLFLCIPGFILLFLNLAWVVTILSTICTRYRDLTRIVVSGLQVIVYLTPIMWMPSFLTGKMHFYLVTLNPIFHIFDVVRAPLLATHPSSLSWIVSLTCALLGWIITVPVYKNNHKKIIFWL